MKTSIFIMFVLHGTMAWGQAKTHQGVYQVLDQDENIVEFFSELEFEGSSLEDAQSVTLAFPETLAGESNKIELVKDKDEWVSHTELFDLIECESNEDYDFSCLMIFNPQNLQKTDFVEVAQNHMQLMAFSGFINANAFSHELSSDFLKVNKGKAKIALQAEGFTGSDLEHRINVIDKFFSEPIGWIRYRKSGIY